MFTSDCEHAVCYASGAYVHGKYVTRGGHVRRTTPFGPVQRSAGRTVSAWRPLGPSLGSRASEAEHALFSSTSGAMYLRRNEHSSLADESHIITLLR